MDNQEKIETLNYFIKNDQGAKKWSLISAVGLFVVGIGASVLVYFLTKESGESMKVISAIPGLTATLVSGVSAKEYFARKNRLFTYNLVRIAYTRPPVSEDIDKRFWTIIDKSLA